MTNNTGRERGPRIVPMTCSACGATMNPHAEKLVVPFGDGDVEGVDWAVGGLIEEIHQCPQCARVQSRRA